MCTKRLTVIDFKCPLCKIVHKLKHDVQPPDYQVRYVWCPTCERRIRLQFEFPRKDDEVGR